MSNPEFVLDEGMTDNIINEEVFNKEINMCQKLMKAQGGCNWGRCMDCGVIPLLYKLHKGQLLEDAEQIKKVKEAIFS